MNTTLIQTITTRQRKNKIKELQDSYGIILPEKNLLSEEIKTQILSNPNKKNKILGRLILDGIQTFSVYDTVLKEKQFDLDKKIKESHQSYVDKSRSFFINDRIALDEKIEKLDSQKDQLSEEIAYYTGLKEIPYPTIDISFVNQLKKFDVDGKQSYLPQFASYAVNGTGEQTLTLTMELINAGYSFGHTEFTLALSYALRNTYREASSFTRYNFSGRDNVKGEFEDKFKQTFNAHGGNNGYGFKDITFGHTFKKIPPLSTLKKIDLAKKHFDEDYIFIVEEAYNWHVNSTTPVSPLDVDPLVIGRKMVRGKVTHFLIDCFDPTPLESAIVNMYAKKTND